MTHVVSPEDRYAAHCILLASNAVMGMAFTNTWVFISVESVELPTAWKTDLWAGHLAGAGFALRCWLCSASADVVMRRVYGALLVAMLVVCRVCAESGPGPPVHWAAFAERTLAMTLLRLLDDRGTILCGMGFCDSILGLLFRWCPLLGL